MFHFIRSNEIIYSLSLIKDKTISRKVYYMKIHFMTPTGIVNPFGSESQT